jgi:hypothetical protein
MTSNYPPGVIGMDPQIIGGDEGPRVNIMPCYWTNGASTRLRGLSWRCECGESGAVNAPRDPASTRNIDDEIDAQILRHVDAHHQQDAPSESNRYGGVLEGLTDPDDLPFD